MSGPKLASKCRTFTLVRNEDETGVSGTGPVAWGCVFPDGVTVTRWAVTEIRQTCVWRSLDDVLAIHGHEGKTVVKWDNYFDNPDHPAPNRSTRWA